MNNLVILYKSDKTPNAISKQNWESYCKLHDIQYVYFDHIINQNISNIDQIFYIYNILEHNNIEYNQLALVSDSTLINLKTPNIFSLTNGKLTFAEWDGDFQYLLSNMEVYNELYFKTTPDFTRFFDMGFFIVNHDHKDIFSKIISFMDINYKTLHTKLDTTFIPHNFFFKCEYTKLSYNYNMIDMERKEILQNKYFKELGYIYNFSNISNKFEIMQEALL